MYSRALSAAYLFFIVPSILSAAQPWTEPFAEDSATIAKAAAALSSDNTAPIRILLDDRRYQIQKGGKFTATFRRVYKIEKQTAIEDWAALEQEWEPWCQSKPQLRARVISPNGSVHWLDHKTIGDASAAQVDSTIFSDSRVIRAPLPAVEVGSVVEYEFVQHETEPLPGAGIAREFIIGGGLSIDEFHLSIDAVPGVPLRIGTNLLPPHGVHRSENNGGIHVAVDIGKQQPQESFEWFTPPEVVTSPEVRFSTGPSWEKIAALYTDVVTRATQELNAPGLYSELGLSDVQLSGTAAEVAARLAAFLHGRVRYTGVEFGDSAVVPNRPWDVIRRHYGDCKDKSTLLVTLLRSAGFDAHLALLRSGTGKDIDPELPGFGLFNHAIVYVGGQNPLWIDATAENSRIGTLPTEDQGRRALIIARSTRALTVIPESTSRDNRIIHTIEIHMRSTGKADIKEVIEASGAFESQWRSRLGNDDSETKEALGRYVKNSFSAKNLGKWTAPKRLDFLHPFKVTVEALESSAAVSDLQGAAAAVSNSFLFENLPFGLGSDLVSGEDKSRKNDFLFAQPYSAEVHFKIIPPLNYAPRRLPAVERQQAGPALYRSEAKLTAEGSVQLDYYFDTGKRRYTPAEFTALRAALKKRAAAPPEVLAFTTKASDLVALGKTAEALRNLREQVAASPKDASVHMQLCQLLLNAGDRSGALLEARRATELDKTSAQPWITLAWAYQRDSFGRLRTGNWQPEEAEKALRKAIELDSDNMDAKFELAILLEYDASGQRYGRRARMKEAADLYRTLLKKGPNPVVSQNLVSLLIQMSSYKEAAEELKAIANQPSYAPLSIALTTLNEGTERAILENRENLDNGTDASSNLANAASLLGQLRRYEQASELLRAAGRLNYTPGLANQLELMSKAKRYEDAFSPEDDPKRPVQELLVLIADEDEGNRTPATLLSRQADPVCWGRTVQKARKGFKAIATRLRSTGVSTAAIPDLLVSMTRLEVRGTGQRLYAVDIMAPMNTGLSTVFVTREDGRYKLFASADDLSVLGRIALDDLAKGDLAGAQALLDAARDRAIPVSKEDDKGPAFRYLWSGTAPETRNAAFVRTAAASLLGTYAGSDEGIRILRAMLQHPSQYMDAGDISFALCEALKRAGRWQQLYTASAALARARGYSDVAFRFSAEARLHLRQWNELELDAGTRLAANAKDHFVLRALALAHIEQHRFDQASDDIRRMKNTPTSFAQDDNLLEAWNSILSGKVDRSIVDVLMKDSSLITHLQDGAEYLYTVALSQLFAGNEEDCRRILEIAWDQGDPSNISSAAWLAHGELLKRYGLAESANESFENANRADNWDDCPLGRLLLPQEIGTTELSHQEKSPPVTKTGGPG